MRRYSGLHLSALFLLVSLSFASNGQTCRSISAGAFLDPGNWDCACDPLACDSIVVQHPLVLDSDIALAAPLSIVGGGITGPWELLCTSLVSNAGTIATRGIRMAYPAALTNQAVVQVGHLSGVTSALLNTGSIAATDSLSIYSTTAPTNMGSITAQVVRMAPLCVNHGTLDCTRLYFGTLQNHGTVHCEANGSPINPIYNQGLLFADTLRSSNAIEIGEQGRAECAILELTGRLDNYGIMRVFGLLINGAPGAPGDLQMHAGSTTETQNYFGSTGSFLRGPGTLCIAEHSENHGIISGPIGICDATPQAVASPYMDAHDGLVLPPVQPCSGDGCATVRVPSHDSADVRLSPIPATDQLIIDPGKHAPRIAAVRLLDASGRRILDAAMEGRLALSLVGMPAGTYFLLGLDRQDERVFNLLVPIIR